MMPRLFALAVVAFAPSALAHEGHGATPAHAHVAGIPVDIGAVVLVVAAGLVGLAVFARARR